MSARPRCSTGFAACRRSSSRYSGGVDSAYLAWVGDTRARRSGALRDGRQRELSGAASRHGARNGAATSASATRSSGPPSSSNPAYRANNTRSLLPLQARAVFTHLSALARERGFAAVADGNNADDRGDYRPGRRAAREFGVVSPLDDGRPDQGRHPRAVARSRAARTWDEPASACLSSRVPYFSEVTEEKLQAIERAKQALRALGLPRASRRAITATWRASSSAATSCRARSSRRWPTSIDRRLRALGFKFVTIDLQRLPPRQPERRNRSEALRHGCSQTLRS